MSGEVASLELVISGKDDASKALDAVAEAATGLTQALQGLPTTAGQAGQNLTEIATSSSAAGTNLESTGHSAEGAGEHFNALGASTQVAQQGLSAASEAANGFGVSISPATAAANELVSVVGDLGKGLGEFALGAGVATVALAGIGAAFVGEVLSGAQEFGIELIHLSELSGMTEASLAGMEIRLTEVGLGAEDAQRSIAFLARQMETLSVGDATSAQTDLAKAIKATGTASREVADAQQRLADAYADTQQHIQDATEKEVEDLELLLEKHTETISRIRDAIATLTDDYNEAEQTRTSDFKDAQADRRDSLKDSLNTMADNHRQALARIALREHEAKTAQARSDVALSKRQEDENYKQATAAAAKREVKADADAKKRFDKQEAAAKKAFDKHLEALQHSIDAENDKYDQNVGKEQQRYEAQLNRLNEAYAKQERATAEHIARTREIEAGKQAGGGGSQSAFEIELRKMLGFAGETKEQTDTLFEAISSGEKNVGDILPLIAEGFKRQAEEAEKSGAHINQAGEAMKIFGRTGYTMLPFLKEGGDAFKNDAALADEFGLSIDPEKVKEYTKAHADLMWALKGIEVQLGQALMPIMSRWLTELTTWVKTHRVEVVGFFEQIGTKVLQFARYLGDHKEEIFGFFKQFGDDAAKVKDIAEKAVTFFNDHWPEIQKVIETAWNASKVPLEALSAILGLIQVAMDLLNGDWGQAWKDMKTALATEWKSIKGYLDQMLAIPKAIIDAFKGADWSSMWGGMKRGIDVMIGWVNRLIEGLDKIQINIPDHIGKGPLQIPVPGGGGSFGIHIPTITPLAAGGIVTRPTLALIAESGPEAVIPLSRGGAGGVTVNFYGNVDARSRQRLKSYGFAVATEMRSRGMVTA